VARLWGPQLTGAVAKLDEAAVKSDIALLHELAANAKINGKLILASYGEDPQCGTEIRPIVQAFSIGDHENMAARALVLGAETHRNVYTPLSLMREDLPWSRKGKEEDVVAVLGIVADFDATDSEGAEGWRKRLPMAPSMVLRTSQLPNASYQCRFLFTRPISREQAKILAQGITKFSGCDPVSADMSHVWRIAGSLNWPNQKKVEDYSRPLEPQLVEIVQPFESPKLVDPDQLLSILNRVSNEGTGRSNKGPQPTDKFPEPVALTELKKWGVPDSVITIIGEGPDPAHPKKQDNSRSAWLFHAVCELVSHEVPDDTIVAVILDPKNKISASVLEKGEHVLEYARRQVARAKEERDDLVLREMNARHAVVENYGGKCVVFTFQPDGKIFHRSFEGFRKSYDHQQVPRGKKVVGRGTYFLTHQNRRQYQSVEFLPGRDAPEGALNHIAGWRSCRKKADANCSLNS
jgi:hypothetical protein